MQNSPTKKLQPRTPEQIVAEQKSAAARLKQEKSDAARAAQQPRAVATRPAAPVATRPAAPPAAMPPDDRSTIGKILGRNCAGEFPRPAF